MVGTINRHLWRIALAKEEKARIRVTQHNPQNAKQLTSGKQQRLRALSDERGVIAAMAIDQHL